MFRFLTTLVRTRPTPPKPLRRRAASRRIQLFVENLEERQLMAAAVFTPALVEAPAGGSSTVNGYALWAPDQIRTKYGFNQLAANTHLTGAGQTIALVEAFDNPNLKPDLDAFDARFGIPAPPLFQKAAHAGVPVTDFSNPQQRSWALEAALDVEWAHAIAPGASIVVYEAASAADGDLMAAVRRAANDTSHPGVSVVSMSFARPESSLDDDTYFNQPANHTPVTFIASSGDQDYIANGFSLNYPAVAPNVLGVGGTFLEANNYEIPWYQNSPTINFFGLADPSHILTGGTNGGYSKVTPEPSYQYGVQNTGERSVPDVGYNADWNDSPIMVYEQATGWVNMGGTSEGAPQWAGLVALANQGRANVNRPTLGNTVADVYALPAADFYTNVYMPAYNTYDGRGTPLADRIVPDLINKVEVPWWVTHPPYVGDYMALSTGTYALAPAGAVSTAPLPTNVGDLPAKKPLIETAILATPPVSPFPQQAAASLPATPAQGTVANRLAEVAPPVSLKAGDPQALTAAAVSALFAGADADRPGADLEGLLSLETGIKLALARSHRPGVD